MTYNILLIGSIGAGKTTLRQCLSDEAIHYSKTQAIEAYGPMVDTPGEYFDHGRFWSALQVTANTVDRILLLCNPTAHDQRIPPGIATTFAPPVVGVITHSDVATPPQLDAAEATLRQAGVSEVIAVDSLTGTGIDDLKGALCPAP